MSLFWRLINDKLIIRLTFVKNSRLEIFEYVQCIGYSPLLLLWCCFGPSKCYLCMLYEYMNCGLVIESLTLPWTSNLRITVLKKHASYISVNKIYEYILYIYLRNLYYLILGVSLRNCVRIMFLVIRNKSWLSPLLCWWANFPTTLDSNPLPSESHFPLVCVKMNFPLGFNEVCPNSQNAFLSLNTKIIILVPRKIHVGIYFVIIPQFKLIFLC